LACPPTAAGKGGCDDEDKHMVVFSLVPALRNRPCLYHKSAMYDDLLVIETRIGFIKRASLRFDYCIFRDETESESLVDGYTVYAFVDPNGRIVRMPGFVQDALSGLTQGE